jgi:alpha-glutamyl/putrescinyl thymine pyrophosphorylase clade 1
MNIANLTGPDLAIAWASERHAIYLRRLAGEPFPWTYDPVLSFSGSFTNVCREYDKTTRWYAEHIRARYQGGPELLATTVAFLWFNLIATGRTFLCVGDDGTNALDRMVETNSVEPLRVALKTQLPPYTNAAYRLTPPRNMLGVLDKVEGCLYTIQGFLDNSGWRKAWDRWVVAPPPLAEVGNWYTFNYNFGTFQAGQNVACVKYAEPFLSARDWATWAYSGDGSRRGLNRVLGRSVEARWDENNWLLAARKAREQLLPRMMAAGVPELHLQDTQNVWCETDKYARVSNEGGKLKRGFALTKDVRVLFGAALEARLDELRTDARARFAAGGIDLSRLDGGDPARVGPNAFSRMMT